MEARGFSKACVQLCLVFPIYPKTPQRETHGETENALQTPFTQESVLPRTVTHDRERSCRPLLLYPDPLWTGCSTPSAPKKTLVEAGITAVCSQMRLMLPADSTSQGVELTLDAQLCFMHEKSTGQTGENEPKYYGLAPILVKWIDLLKLTTQSQIPDSCLYSLSDQVKPDLGLYLILPYSAT